jgi:hypothetical protein
MFKTLILSIALMLLCSMVLPQTSQDSTARSTTFSGSLGITNNGFSIIPTFSLNSPAANVLLSWRRERFSIDPDIRLTPDGKKGGILLWFRYHALETTKFRLRTGFHPAMNLQTRTIKEEGSTREITQMRRFLAWELAPTYKVTDKWQVGVYYLQGNGLQNDGPQTTHFLNLHTTVSGIRMGKNIRLALMPAIYHLSMDRYSGNYFTATGILGHLRYPVTVQSSINKTISSDLPGNKDFLWNVSIVYNFSKRLEWR